MEYYRNDVKSGLFVVVAFIVFIVGIFLVGGVFESFRSRRVVTLHFNNSEQVDAGTEVLYRGKKIGRVTDVLFSTSDEGGVDIICAINLRTKLYKGTRAQISDKSALGGKLIELFPPALPKGLEPIEMADTDIIEGSPPAGLTAAIAALNNLVQENKQQIKEIIKNVNKTVDNINATVTDTRKQINALGDAGQNMIKKVEPQLLATLKSYEDTANKLQADVDELKAKINPILAHTDEMVLEYTELGKDSRALVKDGREFVKGLEEAKDSAIVLFDEVKATTIEALEEVGVVMRDADNVITVNAEPIADFMVQLRQTMRNVELFTFKIAESPSMLFWGEGDGSEPLELSTEEAFERELRATGYAGRVGNHEKKKD